MPVVRVGLVALLLSGCGGPDQIFTGVFSGVVTQTTTCGTAAPKSTLAQLTLALQQNNNAVTDMDPTCPGIAGTAVQNVVTLEPFSCPAMKEPNGDTDIVSFSSGTWTLDQGGTTIAVSLTGTLTSETQVGVSTTCASIWTGSLSLEH